MVEAAQLVEELVTLAHRGGIDVVGVAPAAPFDDTRRILESRKAAGMHGGMHFTYGDPARSTDPGRALPGARSLIVGARSYRRPEPDFPEGPIGRVARYSWRDEYEPLRHGLGRVAARLTELGWSARVLADDNALVDREAAFRAGLGWYGKNCVLLLPGRGSWFVLGSVVTDAALPVSGPARPDGCGSCTRCLKACPTGALVAPGVLDARRCLAWLLEAPGPFPMEYRRALGGRIYGCDDCQDVCPFNRRTRSAVAGPASADDEAWVDLVALLEMDDEAIMSRFGRWYIPRRQPRYVRRNALVALGNVADGHDASVVRVLSRALADEDPIVRSHAVWACHACGRADLLQGMKGDSDPMVMSELTTAAGGL